MPALYQRAEADFYCKRSESLLASAESFSAFTGTLRFDYTLAQQEEETALCFNCMYGKSIFKHYADAESFLFHTFFVLLIFPVSSQHRCLGLC